MGHLILNDLRDDLLERLESRAAANGRSPGEEVNIILEQALRSQGEDFWQRTARRRERLRGRDFGDTTAMIREDRDRRAGLSPDASD